MPVMTQEMWANVFTALSALAALASTIAAFKTVDAARAASSEARATREIERHAGYYELFVLDKAVPAIHAFVEASTKLVGIGISDLNGMDKAVHQQDVVARTQRVVDAFLRVRSNLHRDLYYCTAAWNDESLWSTLSPMLRALEDDTVREIARLVTPSEREEARIVEAIQKRGAGLLRALADYDLQTHTVTKGQDASGLPDYLAA